MFFKKPKKTPVMKLVMTLLVRNNDDILRENILFHISQGVDRFIVTDNNSEDGTVDILREFEKQGILDIIFEEEDNYSQWKWVTRMANLAFTDYKAGWIINNDADEFWWPEGGNLKDALGDVPAEFPLARVPRYDFVPRPEAEGALFDRMIIRDLKPLNHIGLPLPPKMCHRGMPDVVVGHGNHILLEPAGLPAFDKTRIGIMHFPMRSYDRFEEKIMHGGAAVGRNEELPKNSHMGWKNLYEAYMNGTLPDYYNSKIHGPEELQKAIESGQFVRDTRLRDYLRKKKIIQ